MGRQTEPVDTPAWEQRFRATRVSLPEWAKDAPDRCLYVSNPTGTFELYAWDRADGTTRQVTERLHGTTEGALSPDGEHIWWFSDTGGDEFGSWRRQSFAGGPDSDATPGVPPAYPAGLAIGRTRTVVGCSTDDGSVVYVVEPTGARVLYASEHDADLAGMSRDESLVVLEHSEHGDSRHRALRVLTVTGETVWERWDGPGLGLSAVGFSPVDGDSRLLAMHERTGRMLPFLVDPATGAEVHPDLSGLPGDLDADWYPDASALLLRAESRGRSTLHRLPLTGGAADGSVERLPTPVGTVNDATARPDGSVEFSWSSAAEPTVVRSTAGAVVLAPPGRPAPPSVAVSDAFVDGPGGSIHALVATPDGSGPWPTAFVVHGGPTWHDSDAFAADRAAYIDLGCAVVQVNYRGSTGYGSAWRDAITGRPGLTELEDLTAVQDWAVSSGLADPRRCVLTGGSWGGYLTLLGLGTSPERWAAGVAAVPVADYVAAYADEMEQLRAFDRSLFGGSPEQLPELYAQCSPLTYIERLRAPVLVLAGANDPRCPIRQIDNWLAAAAAAGTSVEVYRFDAGHGSLVVDERVRQMRAELEFVARVLGLGAPQAG
ncbi:MAG: prolyl oligopeptidase family serine peptidase [Actinobacteria bacterium]|nr:prolyl oligopeptidase family serine peptidase [Actinomycetota bacterium]MBW3646182.1 prolyl oligopeptidase family serine peptidase [Actinomycetota bacterium]